ncbi:protein FAM169B-like [Erpetoichthys calabaricus]|uniref:Family with sequence similarity 169 member B n=1 Tax=Erpetoichthys calabaricus TaxID=27687 RepID=A0A8C4TQN1_ERPCA|nr:protein FAM169B-like [Erpetoichthys calabaricus]
MSEAKQVVQGHDTLVDILDSLGYEDISESAEEYVSRLNSDPPDQSEWFSLPNGDKVQITKDSVSFLSLFGEDTPIYRLLVLQKSQVIALYVHKRWWSVDEALKTNNPTRQGLIQVQRAGQRVVLFILNMIIFGSVERAPYQHICFSPHPANEYGKISWQDGEAVGFYTFKRKGSLTDSCVSRCYQLPVLDTLFVRKNWRRKGLALEMLADFCGTFGKYEVLGISSPISEGMYQVCRKFLTAHPEERDRLYEVEAPGDWGQRQNIWLLIQLGSIPSDGSNMPSVSLNPQPNQNIFANETGESCSVKISSSVNHLLETEEKFLNKPPDLTIRKRHADSEKVTKKHLKRL